jgi:hypothetical protein
VNWRGCVDKSEPKEQTITAYKVRRDVQSLLAGIRTDLDSFSDIEADALMLSAYRMIEKEMEAAGEHPVAPPAKPEELWRFLRVERLVGGTDQETGEKSREKLRSTLEAAHYEAGKALRLIPGFTRIAKVVKILAAAAAILACWIASGITNSPLVMIPIYPARAILVIAGVGVLAWLLRRWRRDSPAWHYALGLISITVGWTYLLFHVKVLDRVYLRSGPAYEKHYPDIWATPEPQATVSAMKIGASGMD